MVEVVTDALYPHPYNAKLYRQRVPSQRFIEDVAEQMEEPLVVTEEGEIIDGVRRWLAAKELGWDSIEVIEKSYPSVQAEKEAILRHNDDRDETFSQKVRVALEYEEMIAPKLEQRMKAGKPLDEQEDDPLLKSKEGENVTANELAADRVGWGETKYWHAKAIWEAKESGDNEARKLVRQLDDPNPDPDDDISVNGAYMALEKSDETERDEDYIQRGLTDQDDYAEEKREAYGPIQASFETTPSKFKKVLRKCSPRSSLEPTRDYDTEDRPNLFLEIYDGEVHILTSEQLYSIWSRHIINEGYFEDITLNFEDSALEFDDSVGIVIPDDLTVGMAGLLNREIRIELRGPADSRFADALIMTDGSLYSWICAPESLEYHKDALHSINPDHPEAEKFDFSDVEDTEDDDSEETDDTDSEGTDDSDEPDPRETEDRGASAADADW